MVTYSVMLLFARILQTPHSSGVRLYRSALNIILDS